MPSSDPITIPKVLQLVTALNPTSILDIGAGNGRYGLLFREVLDLNYGRFSGWRTRIDALEVEGAYINPVHHYVYDNVFIEDWADFEPSILYDLIFMGDVLEHFLEWGNALRKARFYSKSAIVVAPNWEGSISQGAWHGNEYERHRVELSPELVGGRCLFANSKTFICAFGGGILNANDILL